MKLNRVKLKWLILAGIMPPLYYNLRSFIEQGEKKLSVINDYLFWFGISIGITVLLAIIIFQQINWLEKVLPWKKSVAKRIIAELFITMVTVLSAMTILSYCTYPMHIEFCKCDMSFNAHLFEEYTTGIIMLMLILSITEGSYFFNEWKNGLVLSEKLQKEKVESQLEALRNQANPHFLFNSLNVLSSLVHSDPEKAEEFINQFASVYRYVLNFQEKNIVTLKEELDFLNSYLFLQKNRFKEGLIIDIDIDKENEEYFVLPFSLQFMVENAIKHNIVSKELPLNISVKILESKICVINNIQLRDKQDEDESTGTGLKNLKQRYFLLANIVPEYEEKDGEFIVSIPLLKPEKKEEQEKRNTLRYECRHHRRQYFRHKRRWRSYSKYIIHKVRERRKIKNQK